MNIKNVKRTRNLIPFKRGNPGRPKGALNKLTRTAKENIEKVFEILGGCNGMVKWTKKSARNESIFYTEIYPKILPLDVKHSGEISAILKFRFGENGNGDIKE